MLDNLSGSFDSVPSPPARPSTNLHLSPRHFGPRRNAAQDDRAFIRKLRSAIASRSREQSHPQSVIRLRLLRIATRDWITRVGNGALRALFAQSRLFTAPSWDTLTPYLLAPPAASRNGGLSNGARKHRPRPDRRLFLRGFHRRLAFSASGPPGLHRCREP